MTMWLPNRFWIVWTLGAIPAFSASSQPVDRAADLAVRVHKLLDKEDLKDARLLHPFSKPWLAFSEGQAEALGQMALTGGPHPRDLAELVRRAGRNAAREALFRLDRLSEKSRTKLLERLPYATNPGNLEREILKTFVELTEREFRNVLRLNRTERARWAHEVYKNLEISIKVRGRRFRQVAFLPFAPFVYGWMGQHILREYRGPKDPEFKQYRVYRPNLAFPTVSKRHREILLLKRYAPIIVQEVPTDTKYPPEDNLIGRLVWKTTAKGLLNIQVDPRDPTVYAHYQWRHIGGEDLLQLVYTHWFREHPALKFADPEAGKLEGITVRITVDGEGRPLVYETIYNCGCYHRIYVSRRLEERARARFGPPQKGKKYSIEKKVRFKIDLVVLDALPDPARGEHPILFSWAGYHLPGKITLGRIEDQVRGNKTGESLYRLRPYSELETASFHRIPLGFFDHNGLVHQAGRLESILLLPTGIFYAGHPRQRGTQLIHFDQADFGTGDLFVDHLRWPGSGSGRGHS